MPREKGQILFFVGIFHYCFFASWHQRYRSERERERERERKRERVKERERGRKMERAWEGEGGGKKWCDFLLLECVTPACLPRCPISTVLRERHNAGRRVYIFVYI